MTIGDAISQALYDMDPGGTYNFSWGMGLMWCSNDRDGDYSYTDFDENEFIGRVIDLLTQNTSENQTITTGTDGKRYRVTVEEL